MIRIRTVLQLLLVAGATGASFYMAAKWDGRPRHGSGQTAAAMGRAAMKTPEPNAAATAPAKAIALERDATLAPPERRRAVSESRGDAFAAMSWVPPPPPPPPPPRPPKPAPPTAPPLPFSFVGLMEQGGGPPQAFLSKGNVLLIVAAGDTIDGNTYKVETLTRQQMVITYLPLNMQQTVTVLGDEK